MLRPRNDDLPSLSVLQERLGKWVLLRAQALALCPKGDGFHPKIIFGHKHKTLKGIVCAPRVLHNEVAFALRIARQAHDGHAMVVGCAKRFELALPHLLRRGGAMFGNTGNGLREIKPWFGCVAFPTKWMTGA